MEGHLGPITINRSDRKGSAVRFMGLRQRLRHARGPRVRAVFHREVTGARQRTWALHVFGFIEQSKGYVELDSVVGQATAVLLYLSRIPALKYGSIRNMRIQLISDLHLETYPEYVPSAAPNVDVLVLAGDIGSYQSGSLLMGDDFGLSRFSPRRPDAEWPRVFFLPGNHEFDSLDYDATYVKLRSTCETLGIEWLEREIITIGSVRFVGTTLWSDFEAFANSQATMTGQMQELEKAYRAANYYLCKNTTFRNGKPMLAEDIRALAHECQGWLRSALELPFDGTTVTVTHFAPTLGSADPRYGLTPGTAGFCNSLDHLLPLSQVWMHGHLHCENDFIVSGTEKGKPFSCRVVANPRGYHTKGEDKAFQEHFVVELP